MGSTNGVSRGQLRPYFSGRTPPFLLVGLLVVMGILGFSYWSLNTQYTDLQSELQKLEERLRIYAEKRESVEKQNSALQTQLQQSQNEEGKYKIALDKKQQEVNHLSEQLRYREEDVKSNMEKCEAIALEKKNEIDKLYEKIKMLTAEKNTLAEKIKLMIVERENIDVKLKEIHPVHVPAESLNPALKEQKLPKVELEKPDIENKAEDTTISQSKHILNQDAKNSSSVGKIDVSADPDVGPPPENREARDLKTTTKMPILKENPDIESNKDFSKNANSEMLNNNI